MMTYKKWHILPLLILLLMLLALPAQAAEYTYVDDSADLLTSEQELQFERTAQEIARQYGCGIHIVTLWDYNAYGSDVRSAAEKYFTNHNCGVGSDANGVLLMLSMAERDYALIAHGNIGNTAFTDYGKDVLSEAFLDDFAYDDWAGGFADYLYTSEDFLLAAAEGEPVDVVQGSGLGLTLIMVLLVPALIAGISCGIMAGTMKTARSKTQADDYRRGVQLTERADRFITRTVVRQKIETSSSSSGGTRVNSGGFSGKSGKF